MHIVLFPSLDYRYDLPWHGQASIPVGPKIVFVRDFANSPQLSILQNNLDFTDFNSSGSSIYLVIRSIHEVRTHRARIEEQKGIRREPVMRIMRDIPRFSTSSSRPAAGHRQKRRPTSHMRTPRKC